MAKDDGETGRGQSPAAPIECERQDEIHGEIQIEGKRVQPNQHERAVVRYDPQGGDGEKRDHDAPGGRSDDSLHE